MRELFRIFPEKNFAMVRFAGPIDYKDILSWFDEARFHEDFSKNFDGVVDLRKATFKKTRPEKAEFLASYMIEHDITQAKWAMLVSEPVVTALATIYSKFANLKHPIKNFSTVEAAAAFLERDLEDILLMINE